MFDAMTLHGHLFDPTLEYNGQGLSSIGTNHFSLLWDELSLT